MPAAWRRGWYIGRGDGADGEMKHFLKLEEQIKLLSSVRLSDSWTYKTILRWTWTVKNLESQHQRLLWPSRRKDEKKLRVLFWKMSTRVPLKGLFACQHRALVNKQTNKQNCQIIFFDACKMWWYWKDLKSGKTLCSKSVDTFQNGQLFKSPTLYDAYVWYVSKWAIIQEPSCMRLMWSSLFVELFFPTKWAQRQRPGEFHRIVDCVDPFVNALWT